LEQAGMAFHKRVYQGYDELANEQKERIVRVDGNATPEQIFDRVIQVLKQKNCL
jgi:dTMP kinase